ncbi:MAG: uridylate kinase [Planctomycetota bacterium]|nr:uridylate kinase [Planctomycetaceae bacterium]MDQ3329819.1 uridylate kinase [Planctomycetota bacterium]
MESGAWPVTVYKVGGSLFNWPDLFERLAAFLASENARPLVVPGGGDVADVVRSWDRIHGLGESRSHRLAIASLSLGGEFLTDGLGASIVADRQEAAIAWRAGKVAVLDVRMFLKAESIDAATPLPASWDVTSDSIAAWIADKWPARLMLVKSAAPSLANEPFVDSYFESASAGLKSVQWVDLRSGQRGALGRPKVQRSIQKMVKSNHVR